MAGQDGDSDRETKRAQALRANLRRRKAQQRSRRERADDAAPKGADQADTDSDAGSND